MKKPNLHLMTKLFLTVWMIFLSIIGQSQIHIGEGTTIVVGSGVYMSVSDDEASFSLQAHHFESKILLENTDNHSKKLNELLAEVSSFKNSWDDSPIETKKTGIAKTAVKTEKSVSQVLVNNNEKEFREVKLHSLPAKNCLHSGGYSFLAGTITTNHQITARTSIFEEKLNPIPDLETLKINDGYSSPQIADGIAGEIVARPPPFLA